MKLKKTFILVLASAVFINLVGCEAFVRKFTRKSKNTDNTEEMVLAPVEYKAPATTKEEVYRQYYLYWRSWQEELVESLSRNISRKRETDCIEQAILNLEQMKALFNDAGVKKMSAYLEQMNELKADMANDTYGMRAAFNRSRAETINRKIGKEFSYTKIKGLLK